jgi:hypothetical protein
VACVVRRLEPEHVAAGEAGDELIEPGADAHLVHMRPRDVPERHDGRARQAPPDHRRHERQVVVVHQHDRVGLRGLVDHGIGEALVHRAVRGPVIVVEDRAHLHVMAQRPQAAVREAVAMAALLSRVDPDSAQPVLAAAAPYRDTVTCVDGAAVGRPGAVGDPRAAAGEHDRFEGSDKAARRQLLNTFAARPFVRERLAVGNGNHLIALQRHLGEAPQRPIAPRPIRRRRPQRQPTRRRCQRERRHASAQTGRSR